MRRHPAKSAHPAPGASHAAPAPADARTNATLLPSADTAWRPFSPRADALHTSAFAALLVIACLRTISTYTPFPGWDLDPLVYWLPPSGILPAHSLLLDCLALFASGVILFVHTRHSRPISRTLVLLWIVGFSAIAYHAWLSPTRSVTDRTLGSAWAAALCSAVAAAHACTDPRLRRAALAVFLGLICVQALRGAQQVFFDFPQTIADFRATRESFFASQGWTPDSPMARAYERRITQNDATGWLALSNVYASFAGAGAVAALAAAARSRARSRATLVFGLCAAAGCTALVLSDSKGGFIAAFAGLASIAIFLALRHAAPARRLRLASVLCVALPLSVLALIFLRGLLFLRISELSVLFRWFYVSAAARIGASSFPLGVGPDGFRDAYVLAKNPLSPEDVTSPHSLPFDFWATLSLPALAWIALIAVLLLRIARSTATVIEPILTPAPPSDRTLFRAVLAMPFVATLAAAWLESGATTPAAALLRLAALVVWLTVTWSILRSVLPESAVRLALAGAALTLVAHAQIEMTAVWLPSSMLAFVVLGCAAPPPTPSSTLTPPPSPRRHDAEPAPDSPRSGPFARVLRWLVPILPAAVALATLFDSWLPTRDWQSRLLSSAASARTIAHFTARLDALRSQSPLLPADTLDSVLADLSSRLGTGPITLSELPDAMALLETKTLPDVFVALESASPREMVSDWRVAREASRIALRMAESASDPATPGLAESSPSIDAILDRAARAAAPPDPNLSPHAPPGRFPAPAWAWYSIVLQRAADLAQDRRTEFLARSLEAQRHAARLDPQSLPTALRLLDLTLLASPTNRPIGSPPSPEVAELARRVLELDANAVLDREAAGLTPQQRSHVESLLR